MDWQTALGEPIDPVDQTRVSIRTRVNGRPPARPVDPAAQQVRGERKRLDIQGLRALAVVMVILSHLYNWPRGGFVGVDVFFVISGFVITQQLVRSQRQTGHVSLLEFYAHRIKRILPAAVLVLAGTVIASRIVFFASRAHTVSVDALWALIFGANWHFAHTGTDYFASFTPPSPVQHYWSLSVEEQFYVVWPTLFAVCAWGAVKAGRSRTAPATVVVGILTVASFVWAMGQSSSAPTSAYFSTLTRTWELGVGVTLALVVPALARIPDGIRPALLLLGLGGIVAGAFIIKDTDQFPAPWAALPVLATGLAIVSGTGKEPRLTGFVLRNWVSVRLGDISYGLYLWHWPLLVIAADVMDTHSTGYYAVVLGGTLVGATASFYLFEQRIKHSRWLNPRHESRRRGDTRSVILGDLRLSILALAAVVAAASTVYVVGFWGKTSTNSGGPQLSLGEPSSAVGGVTTKTPLEAAIDKAMTAKSWPKRLTPSLDKVATVRPPEDHAGCGDVSKTKTSACAFGPAGATKTVAVFGDSIAEAWMQGIRTALPDWSVRGVTKADCPAVNVLTYKGTANNTDCFDHRTWAFSRVAQLHPDLVVVSGTSGIENYLADHKTGAAGIAEWQAGMVDTLTKLKKSAKRVIVLSAIPGGKNIQECGTRLSHPADCISTTSTQWYAVRTAEKAAAQKVGVNYVDTLRWFCNAAGKCPPFVGNIMMRHDNVHITPQYSVALAPQLKPVLLGG